MSIKVANLEKDTIYVDIEIKREDWIELSKTCFIKQEDGTGKHVSGTQLVDLLNSLVANHLDDARRSITDRVKCDPDSEFYWKTWNNNPFAGMRVFKSDES